MIEGIYNTEISFLGSKLAHNRVQVGDPFRVRPWNYPYPVSLARINNEHEKLRLSLLLAATALQLVAIGQWNALGTGLSPVRSVTTFSSAIMPPIAGC